MAQDRKQLGAIRYTPEETRRHRDTIEAMFARGDMSDDIVEYMAIHFEVGRVRVNHLLSEVKEKWDQEERENRKYNRSRAVKRIQGIIRAALKAGKFGDALRGEQLLADIQGTKQPIQHEIDISVNETVMHVMSAMTGAQMEEIVAEYKETERLAQAYKEEHPQLPPGEIH